MHVMCSMHVATTCAVCDICTSNLTPETVETEASFVTSAVMRLPLPVLPPLWGGLGISESFRHTLPTGYFGCFHLSRWILAEVIGLFSFRG